MPSITAIDHENLLFRFEITDEERRAQDAVMSAQMLQYVLLIRGFEQRVLDFWDAGKVHGPLHSSIGQEAVAAGASAALGPGDAVTSTHRGHHHFLARKLFHALKGDYDPRSDAVPAEMLDAARRAMAEILGLGAGYCLGRGGSMHMADAESGNLGTNAIVGGGIPIAVGAGLREKLAKGDSVGLTYFGEGAIGQGVFAECANLAVLWKIPVLFVLENNLYSVATAVSNAVSVDPIAKRGLGFDLPAYIVDGMDPAAVFECIRHVRGKAVAGGGPALVECRTYRFKHQGGSQDGTAYGYRTRDEIDEWEKKDPCTQFARQLIDRGVLTEGELEKMKATAKEVVAAAAEFVEAQPQPDTSNLGAGLHSDGSELAGLKYRELEDFPQTKEVRYVEAIAAAILRRMETDESVYVMGEEVGRLGGAFAATKGAYERFPDRTLDTPITEAGFTGAALGSALRGSRPIVEIMYPDFTLVAGDVLMNQAAKVRYMYGDQFQVPMVARTRCGIGTGYGAQHSMDPAALYALFPGWRVVAPSCAFDAIGLLNTAVASDDPVLVIESALLYGEKGAIPEGDLDYAIPFGKAKVYGGGKDLAVVSYSHAVKLCREAIGQVAAEGINCRLVDLRTLDYLHIDWECLRAQIRETGRMLICEQAPSSGSVGAQIADRLQRECFDDLDAPIHRAASENVPMPVSKTLETAALIQIGDIVEAIRRAVR